MITSCPHAHNAFKNRYPALGFNWPLEHVTPFLAKYLDGLNEDCRKEARKWSRWKAQQRYRTTDDGKQKRNGQGRRYRERIKGRKLPETEADNEAARVITQEHFFRLFLRPPRLLRGIYASAAKSLAALLLARLPACHGARSRTGAALETGAYLVRRY